MGKVIKITLQYLSIIKTSLILRLNDLLRARCKFNNVGRLCRLLWVTSLGRLLALLERYKLWYCQLAVKSETDYIIERIFKVTRVSYTKTFEH